LVFVSKKDLWMGIIVWSLNTLFTWISYQLIFVSYDIAGITFMVLMIYLLCTIWFNTRYKIEEDTLKISYGPYRKIIHIGDINSIRYTTNPFVAPALSMHRVEISYCKYGTISISPQDKKAFIQQLQAVNSQIQIRT
jgi:uncharacterized membrane protein YdbT with pleckstrin-like domain